MEDDSSPTGPWPVSHNREAPSVTVPRFGPTGEDNREERVHDDARVIYAGAQQGLAQFAENSRSTSDFIATALRNIGNFFVALIDALPAAIEQIRQLQLLPNWEVIDWTDPSTLEEILIEDGLALAWVPPNRILKRILAAPDRAARRKVIGGSWATIVDACVAELACVKTANLRHHTRYALEAAEAIRAGHASAAQALAANVLDTLLLQRVDSQTRARVTTLKFGRIDISAYELREAIVWGGISGAHRAYDGRTGEAVPRTFTRHGSVHSVSPRQYSRVNAVIALMHTVALLRLLDSEFAPKDLDVAIKRDWAAPPPFGS